MKNMDDSIMMSLFSEDEIGPCTLTPKEIEQQKKAEEKKIKEDKKKKRDEEWKKKAEEEEKKKNPPDDMERIVCVYGERRSFPAEKSLDEIRKEISEEFIEFSPENKNVKMEWFIDEKEKQLIITPLITYAHKGVVQYSISDLKQSIQKEHLARFFRLKTQEGIYEIRINRIGIFSTLIESFPFGDKLEYQEGVKLFLPKIETTVLFQVIGFFQEVYRLYGCLEAAAQIFWSTKEEKYYVYCPFQKVSAIDIVFPWDNKRCAKDVLVLDIHSHHTMRASFSTEDDEFEKATRFYAVVGRIDKFFPDICLRYFNAGTHQEIPLETLFNMSFPLEWLTNIEVSENDQTALY